MDMSSVIVPKSDQINADDLIPGPMTITIRKVEIKGGQEQPVSIFFDGSDKAFRPCKSMSKVLVAAWGPDANAYLGRSLTLYRDPSVKWGGMEVGGIRIGAMSHIDKRMVLALTVTKGNRKPHVVDVLEAPRPAITATPEQVAAAMAAARKGREAFVAHFGALPPDVRAALKPHMDDFGAAARARDQNEAETPTREQMAAAEAAAMEAIRAARMEGEAA